MKNNKFLLAFSITMLLAATFVVSCNKKFDEPPYPTDPNITANTTIKALKALHTSAGAYDEIKTDLIISGVVIADDKSGNLYKNLYIQDSTGAINLLLDATSLYGSYPVGRKLFINCKGLTVSDYNGLIQLGIKAIVNNSPSIEGIPSALISKYITGGSLNNPVVPKAVTLSQLTTNMQDPYLGSLIQLSNYEVIAADVTKTYADTSAYKATRNITIQSCAGTSTNVIIRTSGYANFASYKLPTGNGTVNAIYTTFGTTKQLLVRDTSDVKFYNTRCNGVVIGGPTTVINIADVKALYTGSPATAPAGRRITGIVISDKAAANMQAQNLVLQQGNGLAGIVVRFDAAHPFNLGDSIDVAVSGGTIDKFSGLLQVATLPLFNATLVSTGKTITPRATTNAAINTNIDAWESTLVRLSNVTITGGSGGTWGSNGSTTINDGTATITHFTRSGSTFQATAYPANATSITAIVGRFNATNQIGIRNLTDVVGGTSGGGGTGNALLDENFETITITTPTSDVALAGWVNASEIGTVKYKAATFSSNKYAQVTAFGTNDATATSWLVTKGVNLNATANEILTFETKAGFANGATLKVLVSTNYTGTGNPWAAGVTWTDITSSATLSPGQASGYPTNFTASGNINLNAYTGTIYVAFKYEGADPTGTATDRTTTWQIDNVKIVGN
jgi:hypothetical protein